MTAYINLSGEFAYLSIYLMNWQRGYKLSLLSQLLLFRMIRTAQICWGHFFFFTKSHNWVFSCQKYQTVAAAMKGPGECRAVPLTARSNATPLLHTTPGTSAHERSGLHPTFRNQGCSLLGFQGSSPYKTLWNTRGPGQPLAPQLGFTRAAYPLTTLLRTATMCNLGTLGHQAIVSHHHWNEAVGLF